MANLTHAEGDPKQEKMSGEISAVGSADQPVGLSHAAAPDAGTVLSSIPSFAAASELLSAQYSCLVLNAHRRHVCLPPMFLRKKKTGIQGQLQADLLKFSQM